MAPRLQVQFTAQVEVTVASYCEWDGPLTDLLFDRLLSRRDSLKLEALPPGRTAQAESIRLPLGSPMASNLFQQKGCGAAKGPWQLTASAPALTSDICAHALSTCTLGFWEPFCAKPSSEQAKGNDATTQQRSLGSVRSLRRRVSFLSYPLWSGAVKEENLFAHGTSDI